MVELDQLIEEGALVAPLLEDLRFILDSDIHEDEMSALVNDYMNEIRNNDLIIAIYDLLPATGIISRYNFRRIVRWNMDRKPMELPEYNFGERI